ncbi:MAG: hypothetical protein Q9207_004202 [Kuettlingeria erythrocarpa]
MDACKRLFSDEKPSSKTSSGIKTHSPSFITVSEQGSSSGGSSSVKDFDPQQAESTAGSKASSRHTSSSPSPGESGFAAEVVSPPLSSSGGSNTPQDSPSTRVTSSSRTSLSTFDQTPPQTIAELHIDPQSGGRPFYVPSLGMTFGPCPRHGDLAPPQFTPVTIPPTFARVEEGDINEQLKRTLSWVEAFHNELHTEAAKGAEEQAGEASTEDAIAEVVSLPSDVTPCEAGDDTTWKAAFESREDAHEIELAGLLDKIAGLERDAHQAKVRKETVAKVGKKIVDAANKKLEAAENELAQQKARTKAAESEVASKNNLLVRQQGAIENLQRRLAHAQHQYSALELESSMMRAKEVQPLQQEVARLTSHNREFERYISGQAAQIANQASAIDVSELRAQLEKACEDRDAGHTRFEGAEKAYHELATVLHKARIKMNTQFIRLAQHASENEDFPARGAQTDGLIQKMKVDYHDLEKKANAMFELWKKGQESMTHNQIMHDAAIEESNFKINNLEGLLNRAQEESESLRTDTEEYFAKVKEGSVPTSGLTALQMLYDNSKKTISALKAKIGYQHIQVTNVEGALAKERSEVRQLNRTVVKKESEIDALNAEKILAERAVEDLESWIELSKAGFEHDLKAKDQQLQDAREEIVVLKGDLSAIAQSGELSELSTIIAAQRCEIVNLEARVEELWCEKCQREYEQKHFDAHEAQCIGVTAYNTRISEMNYEHALMEIERLKKHIELSGQGCDPERFELAQKYDELEQEKKSTEQHLQQQLGDQKVYYVGQLQDDLETLEGAKKKFDNVIGRMGMLEDISEELCQHLRAAWTFADQEMTAEEQQVLNDCHQYLDSKEEAIRTLVEGVLVGGLDTPDGEGGVLTQKRSSEFNGAKEEGEAEDWHSDAAPPETSDPNDDDWDHSDLGASEPNGGGSPNEHDINDEPLRMPPPRFSGSIKEDCPQFAPQADECSFTVPSSTESEGEADDVPGPDAPDDIMNEYEPQDEAELSCSAINAHGPSDELGDLQLIGLNTQKEEPIEYEPAEQAETEVFTPGAASIESHQPYVHVQRMAAALGWVAVPLAYVETEHIAVHVDDLAYAFSNGFAYGNVPPPYEPHPQGAMPDYYRPEDFGGEEVDPSENESNEADDGSVAASTFDISEESTAEVEDELEKNFDSSNEWYDEDTTYFPAKELGEGLQPAPLRPSGR